jgi:hypothetical protein
MTAATLTTPSTVSARPLTRRLWNVVRLHAANPFTILGTPLLVLATILAVNWLIWWVIRTATPDDPQSVADVSQGFQYSGASLWIFVYMMVVAIMAMNHSFSFALGFGSTRRDFLLGSAATFTGLAAFYAVVFSLLTAIETWTNGWGLGGTMFNAIWFGIGEPWYLRLFHVFALFLFFFGIGSAFGAMYVRWKARGLILFFSLLAVALAGLVALVTATGSWPAVGEFFVAIGFTGAYALSLAVSVVAGVAGYAILRKATPRS